MGIIVGSMDFNKYFFVFFPLKKQNIQFRKGGQIFNNSVYFPFKFYRVIIVQKMFFSNSPRFLKAT